MHGVGWLERYDYDRAGNITFAGWPTTSADTSAIGKRQYAGTLLRRAARTHYQYDSNGRIVQRSQQRLSGEAAELAVWVGRRRPAIGVTTPDGQRWCYCYDSFGRRISKQRIGPDDTTVVERIDFIWDEAVMIEQIHIGQAEEPRVTTWD